MRSNNLASCGNHLEPSCPQNTERLAVLCKALSHSARVRIVDYLKRIDGCVCGRIVEAMPLAQSTVSQHLKILKAAGVVRGEIEGPRTCYCLNYDVLEEFRVLTANLLDHGPVQDPYEGLHADGDE